MEEDEGEKKTARFFTRWRYILAPCPPNHFQRLYPPPVWPTTKKKGLHGNISLASMAQTRPVAGKPRTNDVGN